MNLAPRRAVLPRSAPCANMRGESPKFLRGRRGNEIFYFFARGGLRRSFVRSRAVLRVRASRKNRARRRRGRSALSFRPLPLSRLGRKNNRDPARVDERGARRAARRIVSRDTEGRDLVRLGDGREYRGAAHAAPRRRLLSRGPTRSQAARSKTLGSRPSPSRRRNTATTFCAPTRSGLRRSPRFSQNAPRRGRRPSLTGGARSS